MSRLNDPAAVVTAQRRRALIQPIMQQFFTPVSMGRGQTGPVRISVGGTHYQVCWSTVPLCLQYCA